MLAAAAATHNLNMFFLLTQLLMIWRGGKRDNLLFSFQPEPLKTTEKEHFFFVFSGCFCYKHGSKAPKDWMRRYLCEGLFISVFVLFFHGGLGNLRNEVRTRLPLHVFSPYQVTPLPVTYPVPKSSPSGRQQDPSWPPAEYHTWS